jgi:hypothetical protein
MSRTCAVRQVRDEKKGSMKTTNARIPDNEKTKAEIPAASQRIMVKKTHRVTFSIDVTLQQKRPTEKHTRRKRID